LARHGQTAATGPAPPLKLPIAFSAWGFHIHQWKPPELASDSSPWASARSRSRSATDHPTDSCVSNVMHATGVAVYAWGTPHGDAARTSGAAAPPRDGWLPNVETDDQTARLLVDFATASPAAACRRHEPREHRGRL